MLEVTAYCPDGEVLSIKPIQVELPYDERKKSRLRVQSVDGQDIGIVLPRGRVINHGALLKATSGEVIEVVAAPETVSTVTADRPLLLMRAAYHLGNRHVALQVTEQWLRYQHDHVLDDMVLGLGLQVAVEKARFEPESGAYAHAHSSDSGSHSGHSYSHDHDHD